MRNQEQETAMYDQPEPQQEDSDRNQEFDDYLDELYEPVKMWGQTFLASDILFRCDPIAYRCYRKEYQDETAQESTH